MGTDRASREILGLNLGYWFRRVIFCLLLIFFNGFLFIAIFVLFCLTSMDNDNGYLTYLRNGNIKWYCTFQHLSHYHNHNHDIHRPDIPTD